MESFSFPPILLTLWSSNLSENELVAKIDTKGTGKPVIINEDGDQPEDRE